MFTALTTLLLTASTALLCAAALAARDSPPYLVLVWLVAGGGGGFCTGLGFAFLVRQLRPAGASRFSSAPVLDSAPTTPINATVAASDTLAGLSAPGASVSQASSAAGVRKCAATGGENPETRDLIYAGASLGWTLGLAAVAVLDAWRYLATDWSYLVAAGLPIAAAAIMAIATARCTRQALSPCEQNHCKGFVPAETNWWPMVSPIRPVRAAIAILMGMIAGTLVVQAWVGLEDVLRCLVALVVAVHLAVGLTMLLHLPDICRQAKRGDS
ncbi:hypothetical protein HRbin36_01596 [bacterium HR36]|nr:hypothetical protein HRbin36_01596 [bacterium HR36]